MIIGIGVRIGVGVDHIKDRIEIGEMVELQATVGLDQVLEPVQIEIELDVMSVGNMTTFHKNVQLDKQIGTQNKYSKCLIWMRIRQYYKPH